MAPRGRVQEGPSFAEVRGPLFKDGLTEAEKAAALRAVPKEVYPELPVPRVGQNENSGLDSLLGDNFAEKPLLARLNWLHVPLLVATPIITLVGILTTPLQLKTFLFAVAYYAFSGLGITAGAW